MRVSRGKVASAVFGGIAGEDVGCFAAIFIGPGRGYTVRLEGLVLLCSTVLGAIVGRHRHGGRLTIGEVKVWVAGVAVLLAASDRIE